MICAPDALRQEGKINSKGKNDRKKKFKETSVFDVEH
jgi:hypothetical protein